jgi:transcriptional regulator GlxA family with amidase domain
MQLFEEAAAIVRREYREDLGLDDMARRLASSRRQVQRAFADAGETTSAPTSSACGWPAPRSSCATPRCR